MSLLNNNQIEEFTSHLYSRLKGKIVDINTVKALSKQWVRNVIDFVNLDRKYYSIQDYKWKFTGKNALILGAGPSLADNIEKIKSMRDKFVVFAVNKTLKYLEENDIVPDFAVFADAKNIGRWYNLSDEYTAKLI